MQDLTFAQDVGRNKSALRQQGRMFPAIGAPETPVLRLTRRQAYSGLRRDVHNDERSAWEREKSFTSHHHLLTTKEKPICIP